MSSQPPTSPAVRRFITRLLILDAIVVPAGVGAFVGYSVEHIGWLLWVALAAMAAMTIGVFWLMFDLKRSQRR